MGLDLVPSRTGLRAAGVKAAVLAPEGMGQAGQGAVPTWQGRQWLDSRQCVCLWVWVWVGERALPLNPLLPPQPRPPPPPTSLTRVLLPPALPTLGLPSYAVASAPPAPQGFF